LLVLTTKTTQLLPLRRRQTVVAAALVQVRLPDPVGDRVGRDLELTGQLKPRATGSYQLDDPVPELRRVRRVGVGASWTPFSAKSKCPRNRVNSTGTPCECV
jgi:hypothetical protein